MRNWHAPGGRLGEQGVTLTQVLVEQAALSEGSILVYKDYGKRVRMAYDPHRTDEEAALNLLRARLPRLGNGRLQIVHRAGV